MDILLMIFSTVIDVAKLLLGLRFMMQLAGVDPYNPVVLSTVRVTHVADVFSRILPTTMQGRFHSAALALIVLLHLIELWGTPIIAGGSGYGAQELLVVAIISLLMSFLTFCKWLIIGSIVVSWIMVLTQSRSPYLTLILQMAEPLLAPFRRILPDLGPIDLSPLVAFLAIMICQKLLSEAGIILLSMI